MLCTELNLSTRHDSHAPHVKLRAHASFAPLVLYSHALHAALCRYDDLFGFIFNSVLDANAVKQVRTTHKARPRVESVVSAVSAVPCCLMPWPPVEPDTRLWAWVVYLGVALLLITQKA